MSKEGKQLLKLKETWWRDTTQMNEININQISRKVIIGKSTLNRESLYVEVNQIKKHKNNLRMRLKEYKTKRNKLEFSLEGKINEIFYTLVSKEKFGIMEKWQELVVDDW